MRNRILARDVEPNRRANDVIDGVLFYLQISRPLVKEHSIALRPTSIDRNIVNHVSNECRAGLPTERVNSAAIRQPLHYMMDVVVGNLVSTAHGRRWLPAPAY